MAAGRHGDDLLLAKFEALVDLSALARALSFPDHTPAETSLVAGFTRPYKLWSPERHPPRPCSTGEHLVPGVRYGLTDPGHGGESVRFSRTELHEVRAHGAAFRPEVRRLLEQSAATPRRYPDDVQPTRPSRQQADAWRVPRDLLFSLDEAWIEAGAVRATGVLQNPTAHTMTVVYFPTGFNNPLTLDLEGATRPRHAPRPSRPPPAEAITLPAYGTVLFSQSMDLSEQEHPPGPGSFVTWTFHYWVDPRPEGKVLLLRSRTPPVDH